MGTPVPCRGPQQVPRFVFLPPASFVPVASFNLYSQVLCTAALPEASFEDLSAQLSTLKGTVFFFVCLASLESISSFFVNRFFFRITAEKEQLVLEHRKALAAQENVSAELKDKLMQAELRHAQELKDAHAAAEAKLDESLKEFSDASAQLRKELEEESRLRKEAQDRNATLTSDQAEYDRLVIQADALALSKSFSFSFLLISLYFLAVCPYTGSFFLLFLSLQSSSLIPSPLRKRG